MKLDEWNDKIEAGDYIEILPVDKAKEKFEENGIDKTNVSNTRDTFRGDKDKLVVKVQEIGGRWKGFDRVKVNINGEVHWFSEVGVRKVYK